MAADIPRYFVKFMPYGQLALSSLINQEIYFSRVYEFNDFTELNVSASESDIEKSLIKQHLVNLDFRVTFQEHFSKQGYTKSYVEHFIRDLRERTSSDFLEDCDVTRQKILMEWIAYYSVGIFSMSDLEVFKDDSAMLMFAHYANKLSGIACIYEILPECISPPKPVKPYGSESFEPVSDYDHRITAWSSQIYTTMNDFLRKSESWGYEKEWRLFSAPGIKKASDSGIKLRAILYSPRFNPSDVKTLKKINNKFYEGKLSIAELHQSFKPDRFKHHFDITPTSPNETDPPLSINWLRALLNINDNEDSPDNT